MHRVSVATARPSEWVVTSVNGLDERKLVYATNRLEHGTGRTEERTRNSDSGVSSSIEPLAHQFARSCRRRSRGDFGFDFGAGGGENEG